MDVGSIFGTVIADGERLSDPRLSHNRLPFGLTGMRSRAELHQRQQRMQAGARHQAERGELRQGLPIGLARGPSGEVILHPDEEMQARIRLVVEKFREIRSAGGVMRYLQTAPLPVPARPRVGPAPYKIVWQPARTSAMLDMLHHPASAGAYVSGRKPFDPARRPPRHPRGGRILQPIDNGERCLHQRYPADLAWEEGVANQTHLRAKSLTYREEHLGWPAKDKPYGKGSYAVGVVERCSIGTPLVNRANGPSLGGALTRASVEEQTVNGCVR